MSDNPDTRRRRDTVCFALGGLPVPLAFALGAVVFWLSVGACGSPGDTDPTGAQQTPAAAETAAPETTAPPATTADNPAPGEPGYDPYLDPCSDVNTAHSRRRAAEARALMDQAETGGPPAADVAGQVAAIRREIGWDRDCEGVWGAEDDARLGALERAAENPPPAEEAADTGEADSPETGDGETPTGTAAPAATDDGSSAPAAEPEQPPVTSVFEDRGPAIPEDQTPDPQAAGAVRLGAPVPLGTWTEQLCPPEDDWAAGGFNGCGDYETDGDYLNSNSFIMGGCYHPPVRLGVGDSYISAATTGTAVDGRRYVLEVAGEILGFSAPELSTDGRWAWVTPRVTGANTYILDNPDGTTERVTPRAPSTGQTLRWVQLGGEAGRTLAADGTLASGVLAVNPELPDGARC